MKVLYVNNLYPPYVVGGAEVSVAELARGVSHFGHECAVLTLVPSRGSISAQDGGINVIGRRIRNIHWPFDQPRSRSAWALWHAMDSYNWLASREVGDVMRVERPDVVHTNNLAGLSVSVWDAARRLGFPVVHTIRDYYLLCRRSTMFSRGENCRSICPACKVFGWPRKRMSGVPTAVVGVSNYVLRRHLEFGYFRSSQVKTAIGNAYSAPSPRRVEGTANESGIRIGYLGRLHPSKGVEVLLDSLRELSQQKWHAVVAGRGDSIYENELKSRYGHLNVEFVGWARPEEILSRIDVLVIPSLWHEPFPRAAIEAFTYGVPVIGSNRGGIPEMIEDGVSGWIFDPERVGELTSVLKTVINGRNALRDLRDPCRRKAAEFRPEVIARRYLGIYEEAIRAFENGERSTEVRESTTAEARAEH